MKKLVTIIFVTILSLLPSINILAEQIKYEDIDSGVVFYVPDNWVQTELSKDREFLDVNFTYTGDSIGTIIYGSTDLWSKLSESDKTGLQRSDFNNDIFTKNDIAEMMNIPQDKVEIIDINGRSYYRFIINQSAYIDELHADISTDITTLYLIEDGWLYMYEFSGNEKLYDDFEHLINSASYESSPSQDEYSTDSIEKSQSDISLKNSYLANLIISLILTICIYYVPIAIYRFVIKKKPISPSKAKIITAVYALIALILMITIRYFIDGRTVNGSALVLWSFINYKTLTNGFKENTHIFDDDEE